VLTRIELRHFKCFALLKLPLCPLTLLSGANASGKSTVMQPLILLHQTIREHEWSTRLMLNGDAIRLGTVADVIDQIHGRDAFDVALLDDEVMYRWTFTGERAEMSMAATSVHVGDGDEDNPSSLHRLLPRSQGEDPLAVRLRDLNYLTAERLGPRETYPLEDPQMTPVVGPTGRHTVSVLHAGGDEPVLDGLVLDGAPPTRRRQVEARMERFFPGCGLELGKIPHANAVTLGLRTSGDVDFHRPIHTGFGLTQVLPIVVAALSMGRDGIFLLENPEVHLHPAGQAMMGEFMASVAAAGVQVLLETHSDHVLSGIRRAVRQRVISPTDVALHFFQPRQESEQDGSPQVQSPILDAEGNIDTWPEGFFDQFDKDMNDFAGWS